MAGVRGANADDLTEMFAVAGLPDDPARIDWPALPHIRLERHLVFRGVEEEAAFNLHSYMAYFDGQFWAMWSCGKVHEDKAGQQVRYSTGPDGRRWRESKVLATPPPGNFRCIARGFWLRDGEILALYSIDEEGKYFGGSLRLVAARWNKEDQVWQDAGVVFEDGINNFPPRKLPNGQWMMSRRNSQMKTSMLIGGIAGINDWRVVPIPDPTDGGQLEEPFWWPLPDGRVTAIFRDNARSKRLYRAVSSDNGETWTTPVRTNFPDATAKFNAVRLDDGRYVMVSNPNPNGRIPLCLAISHDGVVFRSLAVLRDEPTRPRYSGYAKVSGYQYPHVLDHNGKLYVIHAENKEDIAVLEVPHSELDRIVQLPAESVNFAR